jgi:aryl-alcohol dehydrogenase-like predicted oxidoreductase
MVCRQRQEWRTEDRFMGKTGVKVSVLCFGTMSSEYTADESACAALFHRCRALHLTVRPSV